MIYPEHLEQKLGFDQIRHILSLRCRTPLGRDIVASFTFTNNAKTIAHELVCTNEFIRILREDHFPFDFVADLRGELRRIRPEGTYLIESELFSLMRTLTTLDSIQSFFKKDLEGHYTTLASLIYGIEHFAPITKLIGSILDKNGRMADNASPELRRIRHDLIAVTQSISKQIERIMSRARAEGLSDDDMAPTVRDGRLVIPVIARNKRRIAGIIHDESATGKTAYIEPAEVVEANNRIRELEMDERREIIRILISVTDQIRPLVPALADALDKLGLLEFIRAKATFAVEQNAICPLFADKHTIKLHKAVHPLLQISLSKNGRKVVPLDLELDDKARILVISGPNAGGKSVCLKTVGLLQYMFQCGMPVTIGEGSEMGIFDDIFIDIGDEQSLEDDLSTYSSHLINMKHFLRNASAGTLFLVDEFGSGTEPQIGGALAEAILTELNEKKATGVITTHYTNLKHYAASAEGVMNGAMLYDQHNMQPLFMLKTGLPGSSFAVEIARKIGLPNHVIQNALDIVGQDHVDFDKNLRAVLRDKRYWEEKRDNIRRKDKQLEGLLASYDEQLSKLKAEKKAIIDAAKREAAQLMQRANANIENTIRTIKESQAEKESTKAMREAFEKEKADLLADDETPIPQLKPMPAKAKIIPPKPVQPKPQKTVADWKPAKGDNVRVIGQTTIGQILEVKNNELIVAFGGMRMALKADKLEYVSRNEFRKQNLKSTPVQQLSDSIGKRKLDFKSDIDLRGLRADEALQAVISFIDDAVMVGSPKLRILHGTGTGALRKTIRDYLKMCDVVADFADEHVQLGGAGITVVNLDL